MNHLIMKRQNNPQLRLNRFLYVGHIGGILFCLIISGICFYRAFTVEG